MPEHRLEPKLEAAPTCKVRLIREVMSALARTYIALRSMRASAGQGGPGAGQVQARCGPGAGQLRASCGTGADQVRAKCGPAWMIFHEAG